MEFIIAASVILVAGIATAIVMINKNKKDEYDILTASLVCDVVEPTPKKRPRSKKPVNRKRRVSNESIKKRGNRGSGKRKRSRSGGVQKPHRVDKG